MGAALLIRALEIDYSETKTVFISSNAIMDALTEFMFKCSPSAIGVCMELLDCILDIAKELDGDLQRVACERIEAASVVAKCVVKQRDTTYTLVIAGT